MGNKEKLLELFENNKGTYFSGEDIAEKLSVSRTAVWKTVKSLQKDGYRIDAVTNKGYCLSTDTDILSVQGITKYLNPLCDKLQLEVEASVESTNTLAREKAAAGAPEGYTIVAASQTAGRGRFGRSFYSPADTGVYMSIVLRPYQYTAAQAVKFTTIAAVAACEAIEVVSGETVGIKWVNDIYSNGKKVSGILTEASIGLEDGYIEYVILGIGINVAPPKGGFPEEIQSIAGTIFTQNESDGKNRIAAEFLNRFMSYYTEPQTKNYVDEYKKKSIVLGKEVQVISSETSKKATAIDLDENCRLLVRYEDGRTEYLSSGEISVKI